MIFLVLVYIAGSIAFMKFTYVSFNYLHSNQLADMIQDTIKATVKEVPLDAKTGRAYIHEEKLVLAPMPSETSTQRYTYAYDSLDKTIALTTNYAVNLEAGRLRNGKDLNQMFTRVPGVQECTRAFKLSFVDLGALENHEIVGKTALQDGRTLHVYKNQKCTAFFHADFPEALLQTESY